MNEQHFAVLGQGPKFIIHDEFQVVNMVAYFLNEGRNVVVVGDGPLTTVLDAVGYTAGFDEPLDVFDDEGIVFAHLSYEAEVGAVKALGFFGWEEVLDACNVLDELRLVARAGGYDVVHTKVAEDASLYLYLLDVGVEFYLVSRLKLGFCQHVHAREHFYG